jgi:hypothetical protein
MNGEGVIARIRRRACSKRSSSGSIQAKVRAEYVYVYAYVYVYVYVYVTLSPTSRSFNADHELSDLQDLLDEAIQVDFHVQAEDDSPYMVARSLVNMYNQVAQGDVSYVESLKQQYEQNGANQIVAQSMRVRDEFLNGEEDSSSSSGGEEGDDDMDVDEEGDKEPQQPLIDEDGFQVVQRRGRR